MASPHPDSSTNRLIDRLRALASPDPEAEREEVRHKGFVVTVCILASALLWFTFAIRETYTRSIDFDIQVKGLDPGESLSGLPPMTVRAQLEGEGIQLLRLWYDRPTIVVDASQEVVNLQAVAPEFIQGVRIEALSPEELTLQRERRLTRRVPVIPRTRIETRAGHHVVGIMQVEPDSVLVSGAASIIRTISSWSTERSAVLAGPDSLDAMVALSDSLAGLVELEVPEVRLRASVRQFTQGSRRVELRVEGAPAGRRISLEPAAVRVTFQVPLPAYQAAMESPDVYAFVPYERILADTTGAVQPVLRGPSGIVFRGITFEPPVVRWFDVQGGE